MGMLFYAVLRVVGVRRKGASAGGWITFDWLMKWTGGWCNCLIGYRSRLSLSRERNDEWSSLGVRTLSSRRVDVDGSYSRMMRLLGRY